MGDCAGSSSGVALCAVACESSVGVVGGAWGAGVFDVLVADYATAFGWEVALGTMVVAGREEVRTMRHGLGVLVAFYAGVFFVAGGAALAVPLGVCAVQSSVPGERVAVGFHDLVAGGAVLLFYVALGAVLGVDVGFLAVQVHPGLFVVVRDALSVSKFGNGVGVEFAMADGAFIGQEFVGGCGGLCDACEGRAAFLVAVHALRHE